MAAYKRLALKNKPLLETGGAYFCAADGLKEQIARSRYFQTLMPASPLKSGETSVGWKPNQNA